MTECRSYASFPAIKQGRRIPTASSDFSWSDSGDDDDDDTCSVLSSCGSSASDESLLSCASSRAVPDAVDHREVEPRERNRGKVLIEDALGTDADAASVAHVNCSAAQVQYQTDLGQLAGSNIPTTNDLEEALRSNGLLAYVPLADIGLCKPAATPAQQLAATSVQALPGVLPSGQPTKLPWPFPGGTPFSADLTTCPCFMCQAPGSSPVPGLAPSSAAPLPPGSPGSCESEECSFRGPVPSSLAIAAALAAGDMPFLGRPEHLAVSPAEGTPPMPCTPVSWNAAWLMASAGGALCTLPGPHCTMVFPSPWRPLDLPLSSPSLLGGHLPLGLQQ